MICGVTLCDVETRLHGELGWRADNRVDLVPTLERQLQEVVIILCVLEGGAQ